jgi:hypothetical protein
MTMRTTLSNEKGHSKSTSVNVDEFRGSKRRSWSKASERACAADVIRLVPAQALAHIKASTGTRTSSGTLELE